MMTEDMLKELFDKIVSILENDIGEERRINIKKIWNGLSENDCNLFADYLKKIPYKNKKNYLYEVVDNLHTQFTLDWWDAERELILQGKGTRNWTKAEQDIILNINKTTGKLGAHAGKVPDYAIQHMCSKNTYPYYICRVENGQALMTFEHTAKGTGIHSLLGGTRVEVHGYVDELGKYRFNYYQFSKPGLDSSVMTC